MEAKKIRLIHSQSQLHVQKPDVEKFLKKYHAKDLKNVLYYYYYYFV